eukprot:jgi/Botrbrau1/18302/Bobra.0179s0031.1
MRIWNSKRDMESDQKVQESKLAKALADAQKQLSHIDAAVKQQIHSSYCRQVELFRPLLQEQGHRVGQQLLDTLYSFVDPSGDEKKGDKERGPSLASEGLSGLSFTAGPACSGTGEAGSGKPALLPDLWPSKLVLNDVVAAKMDEVCSMYINPVLDPFVVGLSEPFQEAANKARKQSILAMSLACAASAVIGFAAGMWSSRRGGSPH